MKKLLQHIEKTKKNLVIELDTLQDLESVRRLRLNSLRKTYLGIEHSSQELREVLKDLREIDNRKTQVISVLKYISSIQHMLDDVKSSINDSESKKD